MEAAVSMSFSHIEGEMFLLVLYRNNELRLWSVSTLHNIATLSCAETQGVQGRKLEFSRHYIESLSGFIDEKSYSLSYH